MEPTIHRDSIVFEDGIVWRVLVGAFRKKIGVIVESLGQASAFPFFHPARCRFRQDRT